MGATNKNRQHHFFEWLAKSVSSAQLSELYQAFIGLEEELFSNRYMNHMCQPLSDTSDADAIDALYKDLSANRQFMRSYRFGIKLSVLRYYACYNRENQPKPPIKGGEGKKLLGSSGDLLIDRLIHDSITYKDNRPKNGALWIADTPKTKSYIQEFTDIGVNFYFSDSKQQWWTRHQPLKTNMAAAPDPRVVKANREAFYRWLKKQDLDVVTVYSIMGTARKIDEMMLSDDVSPLGLFGISDFDIIRTLLNKVSTREAFLRSDRVENHLWKETVLFYLQFAESLPPTDEVPEWEKALPETRMELVKESQISEEKEVATPAAQPLEAVAVPSASCPAKKHLQQIDLHTSEEDFSRWIKQNKPDAHEEQLIGTLRSAERFARCNHLSGAKFYGVSSNVARMAVNRLTANRAFAKSDSRTYREFKRAMPLFLEYVNEKESRKIESTDISVEINSLSKFQLASIAMEPALLSLLQDERYGDLRSALIRKDILTMDAFKGLNLWVFMNQNGLYNISRRYAIYHELSEQMYTKAKPADTDAYRLVTGKKVYSGATPAAALLHYCQGIASKYPLGIRSLVGMPYNGRGSIVLQSQQRSASDLQMCNPTAFIDARISSEAALNYAKWICKMCKDTDFPVRMEMPQVPCEEPGSAVMSGESLSTNEMTDKKQGKPVQPAIDEGLRIKVEKDVLRSDLEGMTLEQISAKYPRATMASLRQIRDTSVELVDMQDKIVHMDAFVDLEEAADKLHEILEKLMNRNNGYVSAAQLYEYARAEMQMFLNDNDLGNESSVYCIAKHLFQKTEWRGQRYVFTSGSHISRDGDEALHTNMDVFTKYAREHGGFFAFEDLVRYLEQVGIKTGNLRGQMQLGLKPIFFYYSDKEIISAASMEIDSAWLERTQKALNRLFEDVGDHIVLRSIMPFWYELLPTLPGHRPWTPLLFQYILQFYGEELGARTIHTELNQKYDVVHAMLVRRDSQIETFADAVVAHLVDNNIEQRQFEAEELRRLLVNGEMIAGNELIWLVPKAIGTDPRFAWDAAGKNVNIKV